MWYLTFRRERKLQESENKARRKTFEGKTKNLANSLHDVERSALVLHNLSFGRIHHIARHILVYPMFGMFAVIRLLLWARTGTCF